MSYFTLAMLLSLTRHRRASRRTVHECVQQKEDEFRPPRQALHNSVACEQPLWKVEARAPAQDEEQDGEDQDGGRDKRNGERKPRGELVHRWAQLRGARAVHALWNLCKAQPRP